MNTYDMTCPKCESAIIQKTEPITMDYWWPETYGKYNRLECV